MFSSCYGTSSVVVVLSRLVVGAGAADRQPPAARQQQYNKPIFKDRQAIYQELESGMRRLAKKFLETPPFHILPFQKHLQSKMPVLRANSFHSGGKSGIVSFLIGSQP